MDLLTRCFSWFWTFQLYQPISNKYDSINASKISNYSRLCGNLQCHCLGTAGFYSYAAAAGNAEEEQRLQVLRHRDMFQLEHELCRAPQHPGIRCELNALLLPLPEWLIHAWKPIFQGDWVTSRRIDHVPVATTWCWSPAGSPGMLVLLQCLLRWLMMYLWRPMVLKSYSVLQQGFQILLGKKKKAL